MIENYSKLNSSFKRKFIFNFGYNAGFYSEFNNMVLAIIYCLENGYQFILYSKDAKFCIDKGWTDYFMPFCPETRNSINHFINRRRIKSDFISIIRSLLIYIYKLFIRDTFFTSDLWDYFHSREMENKKYNFPELGIYGEDLRTTCGKIVSMIYKFEPKTKSLLISIQHSIEMPNNYVGFHIRRGDKFIETDEISLDKYIDKANFITDIRTAFVLTDDYDVILLLKRQYKDWIFYTLTNTSEHGYVFKKSISKSPNEKKHEMIKLFASIQYLQDSNFFIGTFSSNPGMFLGMVKTSSSTFGVDLNNWQIW